MPTPAPEPGIGAHQEDMAAAQRVLRLRLRDDTFIIAAGNIPIRIKARFLEQTGRDVRWYFLPERFGDVTVCGLWWLARMIRGETITWNDVLDEWDAAGFTSADVELHEEDASDHPEA